MRSDVWLAVLTDSYYTNCLVTDSKHESYCMHCTCASKHAAHKCRSNANRMMHASKF